MKNDIGCNSGSGNNCDRQKALIAVTKNRLDQFRLRLGSKTFHTCSKTTRGLSTVLVNNCKRSLNRRNGLSTVLVHICK